MQRAASRLRHLVLPGLVLLAPIGAGRALPAAAQEEPATSAPGAAAAPPPTARPPRAQPTVARVVARDSRRPDEAGLGDRLTLYVDHLPQLLERVGGDCQSLILFLDDMALPGNPPESCDRFAGTVRFRLVRTEESDLRWHVLLGSPDGFTRSVEVSVGATDDYGFPTDVEAFRLVVLPRAEFYLFLVLLLGALISFGLLAQRSELLRNPDVQPPPGGRRPYSLARCQLAFWSFLVIAAYVFIWLVTEELDTITDSVLALIGIGSGTALGSALIDSGREEKAPRSRAGSAGFLRDALEGPAGVSLHRFQMFTWTLVLGIIFCASVYRSLAMPEFSATLLALMGISSGTYLGFKFPEKEAAAKAPRRGVTAGAADTSGGPAAAGEEQGKGGREAGSDAAPE